MCLALRLRISPALPLLPLTGLLFKDWQIYHYCQFWCHCVRSLIPKDTVVLLKFYGSDHHWSKLLASKLTWWNLDFTFLRGTCTMNVKATEWKWIFKTYFCKVADAPQRHHIWSKPWWCIPLPCTQLWTNKAQNKEIFRILHHLTASLFRTWHRLLNMQAQQNWKHSCNFQIYSKATSAELW